jgi:predicted dehydrogenase
MATNELSAAVIGVGRLGMLHARKMAEIEGVRLAYVADPDEDRAREVASQTGAIPVCSHREVIQKIDLACVAAPGTAHYLIASELVSAGIDVLLEKPMAASLAEARELASRAVKAGVILQIGHLERFNPAIVRLRSMIKSPRFVECHRLAPFTERGTDVDVVLDLMVHDLDVVLSITDSAAVSVEAIGVPVLTDQVDVANARIRFASGLIANLNTSRVAPRRERKIRFFQQDAYISVDYEARRIQVYRKSPAAPGSAYPIISAEQIDLASGDPLQDEIAAFVESARTRTPPLVTADDGVRVMELSERIRSEIETSLTA